MEILYVDYNAPAYPTLDRIVRRIGSDRLRSLLRRLDFDSISRRNPRSQQYMGKLISERHVGGRSAVISLGPEAGAKEAARIAEAGRVVLLWRDGNGTGWSRLERFVFRHRAEGASVWVLNGRRREFELTPSVRRSLLFRRFLEKSFLAEFSMVVVFAVASPVLVCWDLLRGKD
jgi:hypothetical protein